ncbi:MAG: hypothetical protein K5910_04460 [Bacteroidales bacterium]|nr:hypothetical protein [Bacteroidales bacterium]
MEIKFSQELLTILGYARDEAMRTGSYGIGADHIVLGLLRHRDNNACRALAVSGIDVSALKQEIDAQVFAEQAIPWHDQARIRPTRAAGALLSVAAYEMLRHGQHEILSTHFLLALVRSGKGVAAESLRRQGLDYEKLYALMREHRFVLPREARETVLPKVEDLLGPLGEQLTRLYGNAQDKTIFYS